MSRRSARAFVTPRYVSRSNTTSHHSAAIVRDAQCGDGTPELIKVHDPRNRPEQRGWVFGKHNARGVTIHLPEYWPWQHPWTRLFRATHAPPI
jgi:hypothetical protein